MGQEQKSPINTATPKVAPAKSKKFPIALLIIIIVLLFLGLIGGGIYLYLRTHSRSNATTKGLTIPANCPKNMPLYPKSKVISATCKDNAASIESIINVDLKKVKAWYQAELPKYGWKIRGEDSTSYLFDNDNNQIGKVSLSMEKKNTIIKFLIAQKDAQAPNSTSRKSSDTSGSPTDISESLLNWDDYFNSIEPDYSAPADEGTEWDYIEPPTEEYTDEPQDYTEEPTAEPTEEITPEETDTPEPEPTEEPTPNCWVDDKGGTYCE